MRDYYRINERIRSPQLRVITGTGENLGVMSTADALKLAKEKELDLVLISEQANPPVAKILEYNKFLYEERKKTSAVKAKAKKSELKEFVFGPTIGEGDIAIRVERSKEFIKEGNRVKISVKLKGREAEYPDLGFEKIKRFQEELADVAKLESEPRRNGKIISATFCKI
ncbi:translation initiation factor IF-3 [candidate division WWE3 bacterium RIFCSPHIGHO2_12_FULL_38_15]|uniref:Translation initiation factor IF-3 n=1 Tax=candidate division WWE3 bacterium RIFCSPHIGHO2_02_FULL_38_14 TaxID=1802620 RepID=A0A1F4V8I9_UNCKA|nr:MAG: translation initiation factor IF-3 [candidate division WWE3 bacterium RIFCSPHIGHO2_01_FULL_38_45]OGC48695.1 MAG: translation initiation factor IF-3 [candidate division WWE3 bacterium RIFCSPHIGHO2_12_FULL_38_15]OGC53101.1 MAG: translation initiation factor IF-3 [candidate division WWE3 bacterium RIFCSPLOWO2_01_FULL_37_24]OGC53464.1 MAG: translation initiation factor IF-3 [candidate division WWE3 bacterium RIFCSPHIGHO2_02_FULL_38_14]